MANKVDFFIGEALLGDGENIAHVDLMIGSKNGPVGNAFATALTQLSQGHTPLLACIRPNLTTKPQTIIIPKVTLQTLDDTDKIFGPAQTAVAKAVADALEEGIVPIDKVDEWVICASVFIHPKASDYRKIYSFNYGATKLAIKRALKKAPSIDKLFYDKDRAKHPVAKIRVPRLWRPPYLQIALDQPSFSHHEKLLKMIPNSDRIIIEAGTPLVKKEGIQVIKKLRELAPEAFIVADLKTLDVGKLEVDFAFNATADAAVCSGLANNASIDKFILEAQRVGIYGIIDMMEVPDPVAKLKQLSETPDVVILHKGIDTEAVREDPKQRWAMIPKIKALYESKKYVSGRDRVLIAVAGGIVPETANHALDMGADILIVGRYITSAKDPERAVRNLINIIPGHSDIDLKRIHTDDDDVLDK
ncbi:MAG: bifunctional 5,6,7,8-tetrahydromethanopterin hydro-lyase/3-hexulose-6-phosphate synthase [Candidatus Lokiarchaeota archaeon]|nr:bifunctional 5,6,7,8-tetrahydromethanopterin hydro-lyase/3-hexulose-6-phosphate synthase [Candidatus Lokiarchaeota archaeon]